MAMEGAADIPELTENDIPIPKLDYSALGKYSVKDLKDWLRFRGDSLKGCTTKARCVKRILMYVSSGTDGNIVDPTQGKVWQKMKLRKTLGAQPVGQLKVGNYFEATDMVWGKCLKQMPIFTRQEIHDFQRLSGKRVLENATTTTKYASRGELFQQERFINADTIYTCAKDGFFYVKSTCHASKEKRQYQVSVALASTGEVKHAYCTCRAGNGGLDNHTAALMLELAMYSLQDLKTVPEEMAVTSKLCQWMRPRNFHDHIPKVPVMDMTFAKLSPSSSGRRGGISCLLYDARAPFNKLVDPHAVTSAKVTLAGQNPGVPFVNSVMVDKNDTSYLQTTLGPAPYGSVLSYQLALSEDNFKVFCDIDSVPLTTHMASITCYPRFPHKDIECYAAEDMTCQPPHAAFLKALEISEQEATTLETETVDQSLSPKWHDSRSTRLTASAFGSVLQRKRNFDSLAEQIAQHRKLEDFPSFLQAKLRHGIKYETVALEKYKQYLGNNARIVTVSKCGLIINPNNFCLAASPDGKVIDHSCDSPFGILEIKCPHAQKDQDLRTAAATAKFLQVCNDKIHLNKQHEYYAQVQGQLALSGAAWCDFVCYTFQGIAIQRILPDKDYISHMMPKLMEFYMNFLLPVLCAKNDDIGLGEE